MVTLDQSPTSRMPTSRPAPWIYYVLPVLAALLAVLIVGTEPNDDEEFVTLEDEKAFPVTSPDAFVMRTWGPWGDWFDIRYEQPNDYVTYERMKDVELSTSEVPVTEDELVRFVKRLNRARFYTWRYVYPNSQVVMDAGEWSFYIKIQGRTHSSSGETSSPPEYGDVIYALSELVGDPELP